MVVKTQIVLALVAHTLLVEDAQHLVQTIVDPAMQARNLNDDAVVVQTVYEMVGNAMLDGFVVVVESLMAHIYHRLLYIAHGVAKQVDRHHREGMAVGTVVNDILRILVVNAQVLSEPQRLGWKPRLLQLYQDELFLAVRLADRGAKVDAEYAQHLLLAVGVLVRTDFHLHNIFFQQCGKDGTGNTLVFH